MEYITGTNFLLKDSVVTLGKFDGLHIGHRRIIKEVICFGKRGLLSVVFSFDYHPYNLLSDKGFQMIYTEEEKKRCVSQLGPDILIAYPFTRETTAMNAEDFVYEVLVHKLHAKVIIVGEDFQFGHQRKGNVKQLEKLADKFQYKLITVKKEWYQGSEVSSSRTRKELIHGNLKLVNEMLGEPYRIMGEVVYGNQLGKVMFNMPTLNVIPEKNKLLPPNGVYASCTQVGDKLYPGITNIGKKPTIKGSHETGVETHLFNFEGNLYGEIIEVQLVSFLRPERKFPGMDELSRQMHRDKKKAKEILL